jgi:hypothetical protein
VGRGQGAGAVDVEAGSSEGRGVWGGLRPPSPAPSLDGLGAEVLGVLGVAVECAELHPPSMLTTAGLGRVSGEVLGLGRGTVRRAVRELAARGALVRGAEGGAWVPQVRPTGEAFEVCGRSAWASASEAQAVLADFFGSEGSEGSEGAAVLCDTQGASVEVTTRDPWGRAVELVLERDPDAQAWRWTTGERSGAARTVAELRAVARVVFDAWFGPGATPPQPSTPPSPVQAGASEGRR